MSEDEFGGVAVETPTADEFGGVPVTAVADEFGGVPVEPMGQWPDGPTASQQIKRQLRSVAESPIRFERGLGEKIGNVAQGAARTADMVTSGDAARAPVQAVDDFLVAHRARTRGELKVSRPWGQARTPSAAYLERRRQQDEAATLARQQRLETDSPLHKWGTEQVKFSKQVFGGSPDIDDTFISQLVVSAGGMLPDIAMSAVPVVGPAAAATSYGLQAGELQAQEAVATGRPETADKAFVAAAGLGVASERLLSVSPRFWKLAKESRLAGIAPQKFGDAWAKWAAKAPVKARILEGGLREGVQEGSEQAGQNYIASDVAGYDPERPVMKDVPKAAALGAVLGGVVGGASYLVHRQPAKTDGGASVPASRPIDDELPPAPDLSNVRIQTGTDDAGNAVFAPRVDSGELIVDRPETAAAAAPPSTINHQPSTPPPPVPEDPRTITAQMQMLTDGKRSAVLITEGEAMPTLPEGDRFATVELEGYGTMIYNRRLHTPERITELAGQDKLGRILGYGVDRKPKPGTEVGVVTVRGPAPSPGGEGRGEGEIIEKQAVVTDEKNLENVTKAAEKIAEPEDTVQLETAEQVIEGRSQTAEAAPPSTINSPPSTVPVTESHLAQAREAVADLSGEERPPDILDELEGQVTSGPVKFAPDMEDTINASRERVAEVLHKKPWKRLSSAQRKAINRQLRASTSEGLAADQALSGIGGKYAELNADDFANALLDAGEARLLERRKEDSKEVLQMAQEIAEAEAGNLSTLNSPPSTEEVTDWDQAAASTTAEQWADETIAASQGRLHTGIDPELLMAYGIKGAVLISRGVRDFGKWSAEMVQQFGEQVKPHLKDIYQRATRRVNAITARAGKAPSELREEPAYVETRKPALDQIAQDLYGRNYDDLTEFNRGNVQVTLEAEDAALQGRQQSQDAGQRRKGDTGRPPQRRSDAGRSTSVSRHAETVAELRRQWEGARDRGTKSIVSALIGETWKQMRAEVLQQHAIRLEARLREIEPQVNAIMAAVPRTASGDLNLKAFKALPGKQIDLVMELTRADAAQVSVLMQLSGLTSVLYTGAEAHVLHQMEVATGLRPAEAVDPIEAALARAIAASDPWQQQRRGEMHLFGLPKFMTRQAYNGLLRIIRATYRGTKNLAQAIQAGIEWLRAQNLPDFSETDIRAWLAANVTVTPGDDDINIREFSDQLEADQPLPPDPARMVANLLYDRRTNESDAAFAARIMQAVGGPAAAEQVFTDSTNGLPGSVRMFLGQLILKAYGVAGQHEAAAIFYDNTFAAHITDVAQALQSLNAFLALTPEGKLIWAQKKIKRAGDDLMSPVQPQLDAAKKELDDANKTGIEATTASPDVQTAAREAVDAALEKQALTPGSELAEAIRKEVLDTLVASGLITQREAEIFRLHLEGTADNSTLAQKLERAGIPLHDKRADAINQLYKAKTKTEREKIKSRARKARADQTSKAAAKGDEHAIDLAIKRAMKELRVMLGTVIREHHTKAEAVGKSLAEKIAAASGLNEADAKKLAEAVLKRFEALVTARKQKALEKLLKPVLRLARPQLVQRIVERSNQGALSQEQFWNAVRAQLHLPAWSPELAERIRKQVDVLERIPADQTERKQKAHTDLLNIIERAKGIDFLDLGISFYKTNLLTGITTTIKNVASTAQNVMLELPVQLLTHPQHAADLLIMAGEIIKAGSVQGVQGAWDNWQTGILTGSRVDKVQAGRTLEQARFGQRGGVPLNGGMMARGMRAVLESDPGLPYLKMWKPVTLTGTALKNLAEMRVIRFLNAWKFVTRGLGSQDMLFFKPAEEARAAILALRMARTEGLHGEAARDRARQVLGYGAKAVATARAQAEAEGFTGAAAARRTAEILTQNRPLELREDARNFALRATFNAEPYGLFGFLTHILNQGKTHPDGKIRLASNVLFPFTDIIANVLNAQLNYTPVGALRAAFARKSLLGHKLETLTLEQQAEFKRELYVKALLGTTLLAALGLKLASHLDDPDPELALYGAGPENPDDRKGLEAKKWIPHSLKVGDKYYSYGTSPLAIPLAWLGNYQDRVRDARVFKTRSAQRVAQDTSLMAAGAVVNGALVITEQSFLTGMMQVNDILAAKGSEQQAQAFIKLGFRSATSGVIPNAVRQVDRYFDPNVYEQRNTAAILVNNVPFLRGEKGQPSLNALGLPLQRPLASQFASSEATVPPLVAYLAETGNWPSPPNRNEIYPRTGRTMTEAEYYDFVKGSGALAYERLEKLRAEGTLAGYKDDATRAKVISAYFESARKQWRSQHGW